MNTIRMYTKQECAYSERARDFLDDKGIPFEDRDITGDDALREEMVRLSGGRTSTPQIFVGSEHIGGFDDLVKADQQGRLTNLVLTEHASV